MAASTESARVRRRRAWLDIVVYGLAGGVLVAVQKLTEHRFIDSTHYQTGDVLGYTGIVLLALLVFFGIRSYRENAGDGRITFGRGLAVGLPITSISCACSVVAFEIVYFKLVPDFGDKFAACMVERARASGGTPQKIEETAQQARTLKQLYDHPATNAALTFATSFPIGLAVAAISAAILRKR